LESIYKYQQRLLKFSKGLKMRSNFQDINGIIEFCVRRNKSMRITQRYIRMKLKIKISMDALNKRLSILGAAH